MVTYFMFQVPVVTPATEWRTLTNTSVPLKAHQWTFQAFITVIIKSNLNSGSFLDVVNFGWAPPSLTLGIVFRSWTQKQEAPLWESVTWQRATQLSIASGSQQETSHGAAVSLVQLWLSQVLMNNFRNHIKYSKLKCCLPVILHCDIDLFLLFSVHALCMWVVLFWRRTQPMRYFSSLSLRKNLSHRIFYIIHLMSWAGNTMTTFVWTDTLGKVSN